MMHILNLQGNRTSSISITGNTAFLYGMLYIIPALRVIGNRVNLEKLRAPPVGIAIPRFKIRAAYHICR